ncbi:uncharacterized protein EDC65_1661 [Stella humosa]|uniref:Mth938-like domain-containing protein n=1 Tax=Stella humosa TaxID=94 RepID=A0A3N1M866_9PROT|nr:Mth938-like domain-containing protein [Stella humosa]ROP99870.1 uncharacterized protein EDC65_1661 [Stella humosa]BBK30901.1 hypothetical protein STHU_15350 [Stella humosa]
MAVQPAAPVDRQVIQGYGTGRFRVNGIEHAGSIIITPAAVVPWSATDARLDDATIDEILRAAAGAEVLLLGAGSRIVLLPPAQRQALRAAGLVVDVMDTGAACRTYNVLMMEGRLVAAALVALG